MKTRFILTMALAVFAYSSFAQKTEMTRKLTRDEVPVVIVLSLQKDFASLNQNGDWILIYLEDLRTTKLTPEFYEYTCKHNGERVEIYYKPDGSLDHSKGIVQPTTSSLP